MNAFDFASTPITPGLTVIEASAGTGKTFAISHLLPRMLLDGTLATLSECLLVTYTNDAAGELAARVRKVLNLLVRAPSADEAHAEPGIHALRQNFAAEHLQTIIGNALLEVDRLSVCTIHSYCLQILQTEGALCGLPVIPELSMEADVLLANLVREYWENDIANHKAMSCLKEVAGWNLRNDLEFCRAALPYPNATFHPQTDPLEVTIEECENLFARRDQLDVLGLKELYLQIEKPTKETPAITELERHLHNLLAAQSLYDSGVLPALQCFGSNNSWANRQSKAGKELAQKLTDHPLRKWASDLISSMSQSRWQHQQKVLRAVRPRMVEGLARRRWITYDGLISTVHSALHHAHGADALAGALRARHRIALIDESQDTDPQQFAIFKKIFLHPDTGCRMVMIGDPKQAIYAFRGADLNTYLAARKLAGERVYSLNRTFRAPAKLVSAVNSLFQGKQAFLNDDLAFQPAQSGMTVERWLEGDEQGCAAARAEVWLVEETSDGKPNGNKKDLQFLTVQATAERISHMLRKPVMLCKGDETGQDIQREPIHPGHCAVLVDTHGEAQAMADALAARNIPAVRAGSEDLFTCEEAKELLAILRAIHDPRQFRMVCAALSTRMLGYHAARIAQLDEETDALLENFMEWRGIWLRSGIAPAIMAMDTAMGISFNLARLPQAERALTNYRQLVEVLQETAMENKERPDVLLRWFAAEVQIAGSRNSNPEERQMRLESDERAVKIVTMHASKGLEYPLVFCLSLAKMRKPGDLQRLDLPGTPPCFVKLDAATAEQATQLHQAQLADRIRLAYVAVTRAQVKLWIVAGQVQGSQSKTATPLDWLWVPGDPATFDTWRAQAMANGRSERHREGLQARVQAHGLSGIFDIKPLPVPDVTVWQNTADRAALQFSAIAAPAIPQAWGQTSFSALTKEKSPFAGPDESNPTVPAVVPANGFATAARGTAVGTAVHDWIEQWDFSAPDPQKLSEHLDNYPLPKSAKADGFAHAVLDMLGHLRSSVLPGLECPLHIACPDPGASEWNFLLPIAGKLQPAMLAEVFARNGYTGYSTQLQLLPADAVAGFLTGFMDRLVLHNNHWGVIDWKTNDLGADASCYHTETLQQHICRHHYFLQSVLYLVALRRFVGPDASLCGAWVVYLRGVKANTSQGIIHVRPPESLLSDLGKLFH